MILMPDDVDDNYFDNDDDDDDDDVEIQFQRVWALFSCALFILQQMHWTNLLQSTEAKYWVYWRSTNVKTNYKNSPACVIYNGNRTEWSPIWSVIKRVITKLDDRQAGVQFVNHEYDYRPTSDDTKSITN